ncbi:MAG TPA: ATP-dependent zinc metalloprotease FtsH [Acidobacteriaceae bacterium]|nr:ATP-dependent zinc metalloprotease FtsH [Acidobacteriaceae bacterium]
MDNAGNQRWIRVVTNALLILASVYLISTIFPSAERNEIAYSEFLTDVRADRFQQVEITDRELVGVLKENKATPGKAVRPSVVKAARLPGMDEANLLKELEAHGVAFSGKPSSSLGWLSFLALWVLPFVVLAVMFRLTGRRIGRGALTFGRSRAKIYDQSTKTNVTFADVAGVDEAKAELVEVVDFLKHPRKYQALGGRIPKGVLLVGPPGSGKTLLARAVAGEAGVSFFSISGSEFVEMFVGVGAARVRDLFEQAKSKAPCIIFIDELDAIGKVRSAQGVQMSNDEREQTLNQLLVEMDGFDTSQGVIMISATNTPEVLDPALLRGGRFDRQVILDRPDVEGRLAILEVHAKKIKIGRGADLRAIATRTPGMVGSDLATIMNEAALLAARHGKDEVGMPDFDEAIDRVMLGMEKKKQVMSSEEKKRVAYHESGHTLVALSVEHADPVQRVSIIPRTIGAVGYTLQLPLHDRYLMTQPELEDQIAVMLGGRAAEELIYEGVISSGAANDLERASELVRRIVTRFGMSRELGPLTWGEPVPSRFLRTPFEAEQRNYSEHTAWLIDEEERRIVGEIYARVKAILTRKRDQLQKVAAELVLKETLSREELNRLLAQEPAGLTPSSAMPLRGEPS